MKRTNLIKIFFTAVLVAEIIFAGANFFKANRLANTFQNKKESQQKISSSKTQTSPSKLERLSKIFQDNQEISQAIAQNLLTTQSRPFNLNEGEKIFSSSSNFFYGAGGKQSSPEKIPSLIIKGIVKNNNAFLAVVDTEHEKGRLIKKGDTLKDIGGRVTKISLKGITVLVKNNLITYEFK